MRRLIVIFLMMNLSQTVLGSYAYEPYENIVARAELIVVGTVIEKQYIESERSVFTVYQLKIKQIIKGKSEIVEIGIKAIGGCYKRGICVSSSTSFDFDSGDQVFMMLKQGAEDGYFESVRAASTVSYVSDEGILYSNAEDLEINKNNSNERLSGDRATDIEQIKLIVTENSK